MELATGRASTCASSRSRRVLTPRSEADGFEGRLRDAEQYLLYRVRLDHHCGRMTGRLAFDQVEGSWRRSRTRRKRQEAQRWRRTCSISRVSLQAGLAPYRQRANAPAVSRKMLLAGDRLERMFLAAAVLDPAAAAPWAPGARRRALRHRRAPAAARVPRRRAQRGGEGDGRASRRAVGDRRSRGHRRRPGARPRARAEGALGRPGDRGARAGTMSRDDERRHAELVRFRSELREAVSALA